MTAHISSPSRLSAQTINWLENMDTLTAILKSFREKNGGRVQEWSASGDSNELVIELAAVVAEADGLSRLIDSIVDGTEEMVPMPELRERLMRVCMKANTLMGRWQSRMIGREV